MKNFYVQLFILLILLLCNFLVGLLPLVVLRVIGRLTGSGHLTSQRNRVLSFFLHVGGGVFMSVCLLILMPESRQQFEEHEIDHHTEHIQNATEEPSGEHHHDEEFPMPEFVILCGFFATFAIEEALHYILYHCRRKQTTGRKVAFCSCAKRHTECSKTFKAENPEQTMFGREKNRQSPNNFDCSGTFQQNASTANLLQSSLLSPAVPNYGSVTNMVDTTPNEAVPILTTPVLIASTGNVTFVRQRFQDLSSPVTTSTSNVLLVIALSLYALIQGATIGLQTQSSPWVTLLVTCFQQSILVFIIGWVGIAQKEHLMPVMLYVGVLSIMSPFGISLSMFIEQKIDDIPSIVSGVSKAIVCGSLLYLTFCDLLRRRSLKESPHIERFAGFTLGAAIMAALHYISIIL